MTRANSKIKLEKRDWALIVLLVIITAVGWYAYQVNQAHMLSEKVDSESWLSHQVQINKLKACIDTDTKPCDINPIIEQ